MDRHDTLPLLRFVAARRSVAAHERTV